MNENISNLLRKPGVVPGLVGAAAFATGATLGYLLGKRNAVTIVPPEKDVEQLSFHFSDLDPSMFVTSSDEQTEDVVTSLFVGETDAVFTPRYVAVASVDEETIEDVVEAIPEPAVVNIFAIDDPDWDYDAELNTRSGDAPYILHKDEFLNDEMGYHQTTVIYYEGDDILADEADTPVYNYTQLMGPLNWGHGSGDPNVVYIRNEKNRQEWEVLLHRGHFSIEVLGNEYEKELAADEMKHSSNRRFRDV